MKSYLSEELSPLQLQDLLLSSIAPRPIAFVSTVDAEGNNNLAPFSFFNIFSSNPPVLIISPSRRVRDASVKHTLENVLQNPEIVVNVVTYDMIQQVSVASMDFAKGVDEFQKAGFTALDSDLVKPKRVGQSPVQIECRVIEIRELGDQAGAGNLVIAQVLKIHISDSVCAGKAQIDPLKLDLIGRMGGSWYTRALKSAFEIEKPISRIGIGVDSLPEKIRMSNILTGNQLGILAGLEKLPTSAIVEKFITNNEELRKILNKFAGNDLEEALHSYASALINQSNTEEAICVLLSNKI